MAHVEKSETERTLRAHLQASTRDVHDRLDASVSSLGLAQREQYARFLGNQLKAREPIERWAANAMAEAIRPPETAALLRADLRDLESEVPEAGGHSFALPEGADPIGLAWAIAGSLMGNRSMLGHLRKTGSVRDGLPVRFLSDPRMADFWRSIVPLLREEVTIEAAKPAIEAALAVFAHFEDAFAGGEANSAT